MEVGLRHRQSLRPGLASNCVGPSVRRIEASSAQSAAAVRLESTLVELFFKCENGMRSSLKATLVSWKSLVSFKRWGQ